MTLDYGPVVYAVDASHAEPEDRLIVELYGAGEIITFKYAPATPTVPINRFAVVPVDTTKSFLDEALAYIKTMPVMERRPRFAPADLEIAFRVFDETRSADRPQPQVGKPLVVLLKPVEADGFMTRFVAGGDNHPRLVKSVRVA